MTDFGSPYLKINSAFKRDTSIPGNPIIEFNWAQPEFEYLWDVCWRWTEKIDGTNIRLYWDGRTVTLGGRTDRAQIPASITDAIKILGLLEPGQWQAKWPYEGVGDVGIKCPSVTLFGEGYGAGIQKGGGNYRADVGFILFDVLVQDGNTGHKWWLLPEAVQGIADEFGVDTVPFWGELTPGQAWAVLKDGGLHSSFEGVTMEGIVGTPVVPMYDRAGHRVIMKMKQRDWTEYQKVHSVR